MTDTVYETLATYISATNEPNAAVDGAVTDASEFGLPVVDPVIGQLLASFAAALGAGEHTSAVVVSPTAHIPGSFILQGLGSTGSLTCIDPEAENQRRAKEFFRQEGIAAHRLRFLPSRPLEVLGRLAPASYSLIYADIRPTDMVAFINGALPLLKDRGVIVLGGALLDGTVADPTRRDRDTAAAREADEFVRSLEAVSLTRLPLGGGTTIIARTAQ